MSDNPYPRPAAAMLVQMLRIHAWRDDISDDCRAFHEWSADALEEAHKLNCSLASRLELVEAYLESALQQKGGAA